MATYQEKEKILRQEFKDIDLNNDHVLTQDEMLKALDAKLGKPFDRDISQQLWEQIGKEQASVDEFVDMLIQAEELLKSKILNVKRVLESNYQLKRDAESKLETVQQNEKLNIYGVMEGSQVSISILEAQNLKYADYTHVSDPYVVVKVDTQQFQTPNSMGVNPVWHNQTFFFNVKTGNEDVHITVFDFDKFTNNVVIGRLTIPLKRLKSQQRQNLWLDLYERNGNPQGGKINVDMQWIYSKAKYLNDVLNSYKVQIKEQEVELSNLEYDLNSIYEPFIKWQYLYRGLLNQNVAHLPPIAKQGIIRQYNKKPFNQPEIEGYQIFSIAKVITGILLIFSLLVCFQKAQFFDVSEQFSVISQLIIILDFIILYECNALNESKLQTLAILLGFSIFLDVFWMIKFSSNWINTNQQSKADQDYSIEHPLREFIVFLVLLLILIKVNNKKNYFKQIALSLCYWILSQKLTQKPQEVQQQKQQIIHMDFQGSRLQDSRFYLSHGKAIEIK